MIARALIVFVAGAILSTIWPGKLLNLVVRPAEVLGEYMIPGAQTFAIGIDERGFLEITSFISHPLQMKDGSMVTAEGRWSKRGGDLLAIIVVALTAWSIPSLAWKKRLLSAGILAAAISLFISLDIVLVVQADLYSAANVQKLLSLPIPGSDANLEGFNGMMTRGKATAVILNILDSGGRLALAAIIGIFTSIVFQPRQHRNNPAR